LAFHDADGVLISQEVRGRKTHETHSTLRLCPQVFVGSKRHQKNLTALLQLPEKSCSNTFSNLIILNFQKFSPANGKKIFHQTPQHPKDLTARKRIAYDPAAWHPKPSLPGDDRLKFANLLQI